MDPGQKLLAAGPGQQFWDLPSLVRVYYQNGDFGPPAVPGPPDGFPAAAGRFGASGRLPGLSRPGRAGAGFPVSGQRFPDPPFLIRAYCRNNDFGPLAASGPPDG